ncbi:MAG TPA: UDP-N-acetylmuramate dehydrogenase, partial [Deinococcales bacterium]|nr:UDP-N-acetylmuramate dehydrogenase [Deinococcales bacterium]
MTVPEGMGMKPRTVELARLTTIGVGGPASLWVCHTLDELREATREPYRVLGAGSNLLASDAGVPERVIKLGGDFSAADLRTEPADGKLLTGWVGAAKPLPALLRALQKAGLSGLEGLWGIPAVVGGAVRMNAGTRFGEIGDALHQVGLFVNGEERIVSPEALGLGYRHTDLPRGAIVTRVRFALTPSTPEAVQRGMDEADMARKGQPHQRTFGCAFKNPGAASAGRLIDQAGLKGHRVGGAMISLEHGNFIVNTGGATARDVLDLLKAVESRLGVPLEREVEYW